MNDDDKTVGVLDSTVPQREVFLRLMERYRGALQRLASAYVRDPHDREDLVQEIAVALWQAIPRFRGEASERTWLYRVAHNTALTAATKLRRRGRVEMALEEMPADPAQRFPDGDEQLILEQRREWLLQAIRELPPADRQILTLHLEDLSHRDIQEITGVSEGAIATRLSRLRARLAAAIRKQEAEKR